MSFANFLDSAEFQNAGQFSAVFPAQQLKKALALVKLASPKGATAPLRLVLFEDRMLLASFSSDSFAQHLIDVTNTWALPADGGAFLIALETAERLVKAFPKGDASIEIDVGKLLATVRQGSSRVDLPLVNPHGFVDHRARLGMPVEIGRLPIAEVKDALTYVGLLSGRDEKAGVSAALAGLSISDVSYTVRGQAGAEVRKGLAIGGSSSAMLSWTSDTLLGLNLTIPGPCRDFVVKALTLMQDDAATVYRSEDFFLVTDGTRLFGWQRPLKPYPAAESERHLRLSPVDVIRLSRPWLETALSRMSVTADKASTVLLAVTGTNEDAEITLRVVDASTGRLAEDRTSVLRAQAGTAKLAQTRQVGLPLKVLETLVSHFDTDLVTLSFDGHTIRLIDTIGDATVQSVLVCTPH